jgi:hypothetical protein
MRTLFYTTQTNECRNHVLAWNSISEVPAVHLTYSYLGIRNDWRLVEAAREGNFDVIFYVGVFSAPGNPRHSAFREARRFAPLVNLCSDAADTPWHDVLKEYARQECFDLQVAIDGAIDAPVDLAVLTPVSPLVFGGAHTKDIRVGFSGSVSRRRAVMTDVLERFGELAVRDRMEIDGYGDHVRFLKRCRLMLNLSTTGSGERHHIKGRVLEAGWAGCALLEPRESPFHAWFPSDACFPYSNAYEAATLINELTDAQIEHAAGRLSAVVAEKYHPKMIYGEILERLNVDTTLTKPAA